MNSRKAQLGEYRMGWGETQGYGRYMGKIKNSAALMRMLVAVITPYSLNGNLGKDVMSG